MAFIDYSLYDYCRLCDIRISKQLNLVRCPNCHNVLHKKARIAGSKKADIERTKRYKIENPNRINIRKDLLTKQHATL